MDNTRASLVAGSVVKNLRVNAGDTGSIPDPGDPICHKATELVHR